MVHSMINNRYKIVKILGEGGFGKTFLTQDTHMPSGRHSVIKQLKPITNNPQIYKLVQDRFHREAVILEELGNSNNRIPKLYGYFSEDDQFYLVQEYVEGQTLTQKVQQHGVMSESAVKEILKSLLYVLNFVHSRQIIHRDIKPDNIILRDVDGVPVLIDFGAVRESMSTIANSQGQPTSSIVIGTPGFMPPEQAAGRPVYNSDLYSLALTMIYLLTGKIPQELQDPRTADIVWHQYAININISPNLRMVLDKALAYSPNERYLSAKEMIDALQSTSGNFPPITEPPTIIKGNQPQQNAAVNVPPTNNYPPQNYSSGNSGSNWVGGGGTFNTSVSTPPEIQGWNWGAFLVPGLWCFPNQVWIGLISWIPIVGLVMGFTLGARGNTLAWKSRPWQSIQAFKAHQKAWTIAGLCITPIWLPFLIAFSGGLTKGFVTGYNNSSNQNQPSEVSTPSPSISIADSPSPAITSTPTNTTGKFLPVEINNLENYTYNKGLFSLSVPQGWQMRNTSVKGEAIVGWIDKNKNAGIIVHVFAARNGETQQELIDNLKGFVYKDFGSKPGFKMEQPEIFGQTTRIIWTYQYKGNSQLTELGNSFIKKIGNKVSIYTHIVPNDQFNQLEPSLNQIIKSYKVNSAAALP